MSFVTRAVMPTIHLVAAAKPGSYVLPTEPGEAAYGLDATIATGTRTHVVGS
jgi:hypothetical protein